MGLVKAGFQTEREALKAICTDGEQLYDGYGERVLVSFYVPGWGEVDLGGLYLEKPWEPTPGELYEFSNTEDFERVFYGILKDTSEVSTAAYLDDREDSWEFCRPIATKIGE